MLDTGFIATILHYIASINFSLDEALMFLRRRTVLTFIFLALCLTTLFATPVFATTIVVNTAQDLGPNSADNLCSLRVAIMVADGNSNAIDDDCVTGVFEALDVIQISPSLAGTNADPVL